MIRRPPRSTLFPTTPSFRSYVEKAPELAANKRPIWAIERGPGKAASPPVQSVDVSKPGSAQTAYVNTWALGALGRSEEHTSELQSQSNIVCRLLLEKKKHAAIYFFF